MDTGKDSSSNPPDASVHLLSHQMAALSARGKGSQRTQPRCCLLMLCGGGCEDVVGATCACPLLEVECQEEIALGEDKGKPRLQSQ